MADNEKSGQSNFKVLDRRRFDSIGNERPESEPSRPQPSAAAPKAPQPPHASAKAQPQPAERPDRTATSGAAGAPAAGESGDITFSSFIMGLATEALMFLGEMAPPPGMKLEQDLSQARERIEILEILYRKTSGNLDPSEAHLFEQILHSLRLAFVKAKK